MPAARRAHASKPGFSVGRHNTASQHTTLVVSALYHGVHRCGRQRWMHHLHRSCAWRTNAFGRRGHHHGHLAPCLGHCLLAHHGCPARLPCSVACAVRTRTPRPPQPPPQQSSGAPGHQGPEASRSACSRTASVRASTELRTPATAHRRRVRIRMGPQRGPAEGATTTPCASLTCVYSVLARPPVLAASSEDRRRRVPPRAEGCGPADLTASTATSPSSGGRSTSGGVRDILSLRAMAAGTSTGAGTAVRPEFGLEFGFGGGRPWPRDFACVAGVMGRRGGGSAESPTGDPSTDRWRAGTAGPCPAPAML